jgi:hypothetical protein
MAQKITLDKNNKLVIFTDNGKIDEDNNQTTEIKGTFEINAEDVAILGALLNDMSFTKKDVYYKGDWLFTYNIITKDDKIKDLIERLGFCSEEIKRLEELHHECYNKKLSFKEKIEKHNARPFSRKIKLD